MKRSTSSFAIVLSLALATPALADRVHLKDGRTLEGTTHEEGDEVVVTSDSGATTRVKAAEVEKVERAPTRADLYRERLEALEEGSASARFELARWCEFVGMKKEAEKHFEEVLALDPSHAGARAALGFVRDPSGAWVRKDAGKDAGKAAGKAAAADEKAKAAKARLEGEKRAREADKLFREAANKSAKAEARERAKDAFLAFGDDVAFDVLERKLTRGYPEERRTAAELLSRLKPANDVLRLLGRCVVLDDYAPVREQAVKSLWRIGNPETGVLFSQALLQSEPKYRVRAARALRIFPHRDAVKNLIFAASGAGDQGTHRVHLFVGTQRSYISDYELSSGGTGLVVAEVANPIIQVAQEGVCLEVNTQYVTEYETEVRGDTLRFMTGEGRMSPGSWKEWWQQAGTSFELSAQAREQLKSMGKKKDEKK